MLLRYTLFRSLHRCILAVLLLLVFARPGESQAQTAPDGPALPSVAAPAAPPADRSTVKPETDPPQAAVDSNAQAEAVPTDPRMARLLAYEDSLMVLGDSLVGARRYEDREAACVAFIPTLVKALKTPGSFDYPFDRVRSLSVVRSDDERFRVFTFQMMLWDRTYRYFGAIQFADEDLKLRPLIDGSLFMTDSMALTRQLDPDNWYGALYYGMTMRKYKGERYYFLLGFDGQDMFSSRKLVDVLHFDKEGRVHFGAPMLEVPEPTLTDAEFEMGLKPKERSGPAAFTHRFFLEYKTEASASLRYDPELELIVFDHLIPENPLSAGIRSTYVPDGTYEGFRWEKGEWRYVEKVFTQTQAAPPVYAPAQPKTDPGNYEQRRP